ncbi:MAG TPA: hypothetical protein VKA92_14795, partial [Segetibacter sp.]|nr:hypothetical protein [Segetibacter sp.]
MLEEVNSPTYVESTTRTSENADLYIMKKGLNSVPFILLAIFAIISIFIPLATDFNGASTYNFADIAWLLIASALVLLMTPGLSFFYGGM